MAKFKILLADDNMSSNKKLFNKLFDDNENTFSHELAYTWDEYIEKVDEGFDALLLDVNLHEWNVELKDAFEVIPRDMPVILMSQLWSEGDTHKHISTALSEAKDILFSGTLELKAIGKDGWEEYVKSMRNQLSLIIAKQRRQSKVLIEDDEPIRILHLSDPQYGDPSEDELSFLVEKEIAKFVLNELRTRVHFIAVTGDITYSGQPTEFEQAELRLEELLKLFFKNRGERNERLLFVPGNHDVDLKLTAADQIKYEFGSDKPIKVDYSSVDKSHSRYGLQAFRDFAWKVSGNPNWRDADDLLWINDSFRHLGIRFYMLNTVSKVNSRNPNNYHMPISALTDMVTRHSTDDGLFGIILSHHGPAGDMLSCNEKISNWEQTTKAIQNTPIKMIIHGHGHARLSDIVPLSLGKNKEIREAKGKIEHNELLRIMAPTTHLNSTVQPEEEEGRGFNIITLNRNNGKVEKVEVDSYVLSGDSPKRSNNAPWHIRF